MATDDSARPALSGRVRRLLAAHPRRADGLLALAAFAACLPEHLGDPHRLEVLGLSLALAAPLVWRRRAPYPVFLVIAAVACLQWVAAVKTLSDVALLVGAYTVAAHESRRRALVAAAALALGAALQAGRSGGARELVGLAGLATAAAVLGRSVQHRRELVASFEDRAARLERERDQQGRIAAAAERARIARELHDIVAHNLSVMVALADGAVFAAERAPAQATEAMRSVSATGREALGEMRRLLGVLRDDEATDRVPQPGVPQIGRLVEQVRATGLPVELEVAGDGAALPPGAQLTVFRLVQEALTNTLKHAGSQAAARVRLRFEPGEVDVVVTDSGSPGAAPAAGGGRGLDGMRERAAVYAGTVEAGPQSGGGWRVSAHLSLEPGTAA